MTLLHFTRLYTLFLILLIALVLPTHAQADSPDVAQVADIAYGQTVQATITDLAFFDWWRIEMTRGDVIFIEMAASEGLAPVLAVLDENRSVLARSNDTEPTPADGTASLRFQAEADAEYTLLATRDGNREGATTGSYTLSVLLLEGTPPRENRRTEVEFRCDDMLVTQASNFSLREDVLPSEPDQNSADAESNELLEFYRLTVFGLDGFHPVIRAESEASAGVLECTDDGQRVPGSSLNWPDLPAQNITQDDLADVAQLTLRNLSTQSANAERFGEVTFTVGSLDGASGRYVAVLEGLRIHQNSDADDLLLRLGPLARDTALRVYMLAASDAPRFDPQMQVLDAQDGFEVLRTCDDAGRFGCDDIASVAGATLTLVTPPVATITADRFDAGVLLAPGDTDPMLLRLQSRDRRTDGAYTLILIGELP